MILRIIAAYLCLGVAVEAIEEMIVVKNSEKSFGIGMGYNLMFYLIILHDILVWPFGIVALIRGLRRIRKEGKDELMKRIEKIDELYRK